jgi:hypothetical protein
VGRGDAGFQGIDPALLARLMTTLSGGVTRAQPLADSYLARFSRLGLDTGSVRRLQSDYDWAASQQAMLSRRHTLASHQPPGGFTGGMTAEGAGPLAFTTSAAAAKAGTGAAEKLSALLAAGDDSAATQQLAALAEHGSDPDYMTAFTDWAGQHNSSLLTLGQPGFAAYYSSLQAWFRSTGTLWSSPQALHDHAWGGPTRPNGPPHAPDFGAESQQEYAKLAYQFLADAKASGYAVKLQGSTIRIYDQATNTFAAFGADGTVRTFFKPGTGAAYWTTQPGSPPTGPDLEATAGNAATRIDADASWFARAGRLMDTPVARAGGRVLQVAGAAADVYTIADPSPGALGGANTERVMAAANLTGMAVTAGPAAAFLAANSLDWVPVAGEVVMAATAAYFIGDLVYENRQAIGHALSWAGHETAHLADDVEHDVASGVSHAWDSIFG